MWNSLKTIRKYLWRYRWSLALGGMCLVLKDVAQVSQPLVIGRAVDSIKGGGPFFLRYVGVLVGLALVKGFFQYWMRVIIIGTSRDIEYDLRNDLFHHLVGLAPDYYGRTRTGDIMARATNDLNAVRMMLGPGVMYWFETSPHVCARGRRDAAVRLAPGNLRHPAGARGEPGGDSVWPRDS